MGRPLSPSRSGKMPFMLLRLWSTYEDALRILPLGRLDHPPFDLRKNSHRAKNATNVRKVASIILYISMLYP